jgi:type I restriction enzyme M protein
VRLIIKLKAGLSMNKENIIQKIWNLCNVLRGDGISYHQYISELTYLIFLKIAQETQTEHLLPKGSRWENLVAYDGYNLLGYYQKMLTHLGATAESKIVREIYAFPTTVFSHSENLKVVIDGISKIDWHSISEDGIGQIYEGLLAKNSEDTRSGAGQYFTPRALVDCMVQVTKPQLGETIQDPATGTGGFLIAAEQYVKETTKKPHYKEKPPLYQGIEIERGTYRLCLMNIFLHNMEADIILGDALTEDVSVLKKANLILANPPFGSKSGSVRENRQDISFSSVNKQLQFLQHIYKWLKPNGRAAVVLPDNVLFEGNAGKLIRQELMNQCNLHTILRLPTGIFYSPGVKTHVLFFTRGEAEHNQTKKVWVYDMRANMPRFGKRTPLLYKHFQHFIECYGGNPMGNSERKDQGDFSRFRCFSREYISHHNDNLMIKWLHDESDQNILSEPQDLAITAISELENAVSDLRIILELLSEEGAAYE